MTDRAAAPPSERPLPPLPEPAETALVQGTAMQGGEYRTLSLDYEEWTARYSVRQMRAYVLADRAASAPQAVRRPLTDEQIAKAARTALGPAEEEGAWGDDTLNAIWVRAIAVPLVRAVEKLHGIVPLAPQDGGRE